jgi:hypothetical protein
MGIRAVYPLNPSPLVRSGAMALGPSDPVSAGIGGGALGSVATGAGSGSGFGFGAGFGAGGGGGGGGGGVVQRLRRHAGSAGTGAGSVSE